jgi:hypothetical protein
MYFAEAFSITPTEEDDWFDRLLETDTQLFVDPFLIFAETEGFWSEAGDALAGHFQRGFEMLAGHQNSPGSLQYKKTIQYMLFPEPKEFGLGFVSKGDRGSGTGLGFAKKIVEAMSLAIERGLADLVRFEELGVLVDRVGRDRIGDITCNVLKSMFITYTQEVAARHSLEVEEVEVANGRWDEIRKRWDKAVVELPINQLNGEPLLLTPRRFLRELPTLNSGDWWEFAEPSLRDDLNLEINERLNKEQIIAIAKRYPDKVREWTESRSNEEPTPYDVEGDPVGLHNWQRITRDIAKELPLTVGDVTPANLPEFVRMVNEKFQHQVENRRGWELLRNDDTRKPKNELSIQLLYRGVVESYCDAHNVRVDREVELGKGPVDFVFTSGSERVLLEIKKLNNGKFWNGLEYQLTSYLTSEGGCSAGWLLVVNLVGTKTENDRAAKLPQQTKAIAATTGFDLRSMVVDARPKRSASTIEGDVDWYEGVDDPEFPEDS